VITVIVSSGTWPVPNNAPTKQRDCLRNDTDACGDAGAVAEGELGEVFDGIESDPVGGPP
jgi:hypothetical protein